jgi:hypothetical protein
MYHVGIQVEISGNRSSTAPVDIQMEKQLAQPACCSEKDPHAGAERHRQGRSESERSAAPPGLLRSLRDRTKNTAHPNRGGAAIGVIEYQRDLAPLCPGVGVSTRFTRRTFTQFF